MNSQMLPLTYKKIWQSALNIFKISFKQVWIIAFLFALLSSGSNVVMRHFPVEQGHFPILFLILFVLQVIVGVYFTSLILHRVYALSIDPKVSFNQSAKIIGHKLPVLILNTLLVSIITLTGLILFVVPGIFAIVFLFFCLPFIVLEEKGVFDALKDSCLLVWNNWWRTFLVMAPVVVVNFLLSYVINRITANNIWLVGITQILILTVFFPFFYALLLVQFNDLKARKTSAK